MRARGQAHTQANSKLAQLSATGALLSMRCGGKDLPVATGHAPLLVAMHQQGTGHRRRRFCASEVICHEGLAVVQSCLAVTTSTPGMLRPRWLIEWRHGVVAGAAGGLDDQDGAGGAASGSDGEDGNASDQEARAQRAQRAAPEEGDTAAGDGGNDGEADNVEEEAAVAALRETRIDKVRLTECSVIECASSSVT